MAREVELINPVHDCRLCRVDFKALFLPLVPLNFHIHLAETIGRDRTIKEPLSGVLLHGP
ncbi:hypothetical protein [Geobacter sp. AOG1]|uniref:hypothetical protein n=1 Tax=Geobacter sp. AOG1 TaxID=1566346 RepID=UPI001CC3CB7E|nr:hypothetical protein [Geobacter sp. AOG1]